MAGAGAAAAEAGATGAEAMAAAEGAAASATGAGGVGGFLAALGSVAGVSAGIAVAATAPFAATLAVAKIASIDDTISRVANGREIVTKVDMGTYENRIASRKRVSELKTAMDVRINKLQRMAVLEMFSEKDPEMKALLDEYKALTEQKGEVQKDGE